MELEDKLKIKLLIGDANYPMTIDRGQEEVLREAARRINDMLNRYRDTFPGLSKEQYLAMVALHNGVMNLEKTGMNDTAPFAERLQQSIDLISDYLDEKQ